MDEQKKIKSVSIRTVLAGSIVALVILIIISFLFVGFFPRNGLALRLRGVFPYPAIIVKNTHPILFHEIDNDVISIRRFYESQSDDLSKAGLRIDFSTADGQKRLMVREKELLNKMVEDMAIGILAKDRDIVIDQNTVKQAVEQKIIAFGNTKDEVSKQLDRLYGWTIDDFEHKIVGPEMYKDALSKVYMQDIDTSSRAQQKIIKAQDELKKGTSFEDVTKRYSEGKTAQEGGELGWIAVSDLAPEIKQVVQKQTINQASDIVETPLGFHIVVLEERRLEQDRDIVRLKQIFSRKITFSDWLTEQMKGMNIIVLFKGYMWDKETARIEFTQPAMKSFEENMIRQSQGDASVMF